MTGILKNGLISGAITYPSKSSVTPTASAYGNGVFVSVTTQQTIQNSTDGGLNWTDETWTDINAIAVTYGDGMFVAVGLVAAINTSTDGITWTNRSWTNITATSVTYGDGMFVAVGNTDQISYSTDGITWTTVTAIDINATDVAYGDGLFVAIGTAGSTNKGIKSTDGINWVNTTFSLLSPYALSFGESTWIAPSGSIVNRFFNDVYEYTVPSGKTLSGKILLTDSGYSTGQDNYSEALVNNVKYVVSHTSYDSTNSIDNIITSNNISQNAISIPIVAPSDYPIRIDVRNNHTVSFTITGYED